MKKLTIIILFVGITVSLTAQEKKKKTLEEKVQNKLEEYQEELNLNTKQTAEVKVILTEKYTAMNVEKKKIKEAEKKIDNLKADSKRRIKAVLTEEQVEKMKEGKKKKK